MNMLRALGFVLALTIGSLPQAVAAQTSPDNAITVGRKMNEVTETGAFKNRYSDFLAMAEAATGNSYNQTLRGGMELLYQNADASWSMATITLGPALQARLEALNALDPVKDRAAFDKQAAELGKLLAPQIPSLNEQLVAKAGAMQPRAAAISLRDGKIVILDDVVLSFMKPTDPNAPSIVSGFKSLVDTYSLDKTRDYLLVYQPCSLYQPVAAYTTGGFNALIDGYKKQVPKSNNGFTYGTDGSVYVDSPSAKAKGPQLTSQQKTVIDSKMTADVMKLLPKLFPDSGACAVKPFQLRMAERDDLPLEREDSGSPLVGARISDGEIASQTNLLIGKIFDNSFTLAEGKDAQLAAACLEFPELKLMIWDGKAVSLYRPGTDLKYSSKSIDEVATMLKTTPVKKGMVILAVGKGFKNDIKFALVNNIPATPN
jgi:hypothetical protein